MSSDILDVFNVKRLQPPKKKQKLETGQKLTGVSRELYNLLGENTPAIQLQSGTKFKQRLNNKTKPSRWKWTKFKNGARHDGLELSHWLKAIGTPAAYEFEQFNQKLKIPVFDKSVYERLIKANDDEKQQWDFEETKYLFDIGSMYDLKWIIIHDRYEAATARSLEELKERFYFVCEAILSDENKILKEAGILDETKNKLIDSLKSFSKDKEVERKKYLERLLARSPAEIAEEESLVIEARRFEQAAQKMLSERASLLNMLDAPSSTGNINQYLSSQGLSQLYNALLFSDKSKKKGRTETPPPHSATSILTPVSAVSLTKTMLPESQDPVAQMLNKKLTGKEEEAYGLSYHQERLQAGVHLRSSRIATYKPTVQSKLAGVLNELKLSSRPVILTEPVVKKFNNLTEVIATLLETKKQIDKLETEMKLITKS